jgi:intraflagellar transport protein 46
MQDSDDDGFAKQGGEPIDIGADFDDSEEEPDDDEEEEPTSSKPQAM